MADFLRKIFKSDDKQQQQQQQQAPKLGRDDFQDLCALGRGSFAKVVLSRNLRTGELVALKVIEKQTVLQQHRERDAFIERNILRRVTSPFILQLYATFQTEHKLFFVIQYAAGGDFDKHLNNQPDKKLPPQACRIYAAQVFLALKSLHEASIIYRDLKPENLLLTGDGNVLLADFGLSKDFGEQAATGGAGAQTAQSFVGSPFYVSPDVLRQQKYDKSVDWWSYGILIYRMLYGATPFTGRTMKEVFDAILTKPVQFPSPGVEGDAAAKDLILRCLERDPARRITAEGIAQHPYWQANGGMSALSFDEVAGLKMQIPGWVVPQLPAAAQQGGGGGAQTQQQHNAAAAVTHTQDGAAAIGQNQQQRFTGFTHGQK